MIEQITGAPVSEAKVDEALHSATADGIVEEFATHDFVEESSNPDDAKSAIHDVLNTPSGRKLLEMTDDEFLKALASN